MPLIAERAVSIIYVTHPLNGFLRYLEPETADVRIVSLGMHVSEALGPWKEYLDRMSGDVLPKGWTRSAYTLDDAALNLEMFANNEAEPVHFNLLFRTDWEDRPRHMASLFLTRDGRMAGYLLLKPLFSLGYGGTGSPPGVEKKGRSEDEKHPMEPLVASLLLGDDEYVPPRKRKPREKPAPKAPPQSPPESPPENPPTDPPKDEKEKKGRGFMEMLTGRGGSS